MTIIHGVSPLSDCRIKKDACAPHDPYRPADRDCAQRAGEIYRRHVAVEPIGERREREMTMLEIQSSCFDQYNKMMPRTKRPASVVRQIENGRLFGRRRGGRGHGALQVVSFRDQRSVGTAQRPRRTLNGQASLIITRLARLFFAPESAANRRL